MKKLLFIDRDDTLIREPKTDYQVDSLEKLEFMPGVFKYLSKINQEFDFDLVIITNQDGLGTKSFPEADFWPAHNKMITAFENEGVLFRDVLIDRSLPKDNAPTRKPGIALLEKYLYGNFDIENSFVIGDRSTDVQLAKNLKCKSILFLNAESDPQPDYYAKDWSGVYNILKNNSRKVVELRTTNETEIRIELNLDGHGNSNIQTGIGFYDHMLEQVAKHASIDLDIKVKGDLHIDEHHSIEDVAITLGIAFRKALGDKKGIERYGFLLPMDDCLAQVAIDFGGRPWLVWDAPFNREKIGDMPTEMFMHIFKSFSDNALCNLNIKAEGDNEHHKIESIFKAFAHAIKMAITKNDEGQIPSTKGSI